MANQWLAFHHPIVFQVIQTPDAARGLHPGHQSFGNQAAVKTIVASVAHRLNGVGKVALAQHKAAFGGCVVVEENLRCRRRSL